MLSETLTCAKWEWLSISQRKRSYTHHMIKRTPVEKVGIFKYLSESVR